MKTSQDYHKGRGAQFNTANRFVPSIQVREHAEAIDDWTESAPATEYIETRAASIVNKVTSPDVHMLYSMNPYMGCEHGCIYCYARNSFEYWGYSAGMDFESKILVKKNAPELLRKFLNHPKWECQPISLSGNTDCYQPAEKKYGITRTLLEICNNYNQPVGIITKNAAILRDKALLQEMAAKRMATVIVTITSLDESLRQKMEPRTTTVAQRMRVINELNEAGVPTGVMVGPVIPGLNDNELPRILKLAAEQGAPFSAYTFIRLNGAVQWLFKDWLQKNFPDRADKVWHLIEDGHGGKVSDSRFGTRMRGEGAMAEIIRQQFKKFSEIYGLTQPREGLDCSKFCTPGGRQLGLF